MTFGEKLQGLRKQNNMSQEELAARLEVSRQAVSKWELDSSLPDTANMIAVSRLFGVSIDFLLKDEVETQVELPASPRGSAPDTRRHTALVVGIGVLAVGLLVSCVGWRQFQTAIAVGVGIVLQIIGIAAFELLYRRAPHATQRRWFYAAAFWLVCPFIAMALARLVLAFYPNPYPFWAQLLAGAAIYLASCGIATAMLLMRGRNQKRQVQREPDENKGDG